MKLHVASIILIIVIFWFEPEGIYPENEAAGRLPGLDGNAKMSKSLVIGIFLSR